MNEETIKRFMQAKDRAKRLIQMDANGSLDNVTESLQKQGKIDYSLTDNGQLVEQTAKPKDTPSYNNIQQVAATKTNSKLPKEILESFAQNNIDTSMLGVSVGQSSVLDQIDKLTNGNVFKEEKQQPKKQVVTEAISNNVSNVDYGMIKMIVEDCMKKYTSALKKSIINESKNMLGESNSLQAMKIGNKFSFIDNNGNLYEANLKFIKNIKKA